MTFEHQEARIGVASRGFARSPELRVELLARYGNVIFNDTGRVLNRVEVVDFLKGCTKAIVGQEPIDDEVLSHLPGLKVISKYGVGLDNIDREALQRNGVLLGWVGGVNRRSVSELVLSMIIASLRKVPLANADLRAGMWKQYVGSQLTGKTVGIIGCGHIGKDLVRLLGPFECTILVNDIRDYPEFFREHGVQPVELESLLRQSDVVTLHVPADPSTYGILNARRLSMLKETAVLINAARGRLVDELALREMLKAGKVAAAAFDVYSSEPPQDIELLNLPNFLGTPHIGGGAREAIQAMGRAAIDGLETAGPALAQT